MTHPIYSDTSLKSFTLSRLKDIGSGFNLNPDGDKRLKSTWVAAILKYQDRAIQLITPDEPVEIITAPNEPDCGDTLHDKPAPQPPSVNDDVDPDLDIIPEIDDALICNELGLTFRNPWAQCTRKGHIEPSGSIVAEVFQDDRYIGNIRRHYTAAGLFYTPDRNWDGTEYATHYAAALSLLDAGDVEIARATVERDTDDRYITVFLAPQSAPIPQGKQCQLTEYVAKDQTDAMLLAQIIANGGRWFEIWSNGHDNYNSVAPGHYRPIGTIKMSPNGRCEYFLGRRGLNSGHNPIANSLEDAKEGIKRDFIAQQSPRAAKAWGEYLGVSQLAYS